MSKTLNFKTNVLLKSIIGKDLINNDNIAVLELVKNAFDANSKLVRVAFSNLKQNDDTIVETYSKKTSRIIIQDWGIGMSLDDIKDKWLNIAYSDKKQKKVEYNRVLAGAKGVGRFSCDRLGEYLDLYTRKKGEEIIHVNIDWNAFEIENQKDLEIQQINISYEYISNKQFTKQTGFALFNQGTILEISKLRNKWALLEGENKAIWNVSKLIDLRNYLEKLLHPNQIFHKSKFDIKLEAKEFIDEDKKVDLSKKINGLIKNKIFERLDFTTTSIESEIEENGKTITTTLKDKNRVIFRVVEKNNAFQLLSDVKIVLYYLNQYAKIYFKKQTSIRSVDFGSIFLFINGFRVNPLGDKGNDWLGLELRKGQGYARYLGTREVVGRIEVNDPETQLKIISSREGVVQDERFKQIVVPSKPYGGYFFRIFRRLERYVVEGLGWDKIPDLGIVDSEEDGNSSAFIQDFEKKVNSKNWDYNPKEEIYTESQQEKDHRIIQLIYSIIGAKPKDIIELYINSDLIESLAEQEKKKVAEFLKDFEKYDPSILDRKTIDAFKRIKSVLKEKEEELEKVKEKTKRLQEHAERQKKKIGELSEANRQKTSQILFLQSIKSQDLDNVVQLHHEIGICSSTIENDLRTLKRRLDKNQSINVEGLTPFLQRISFENKKILTISRLATKANFSLKDTQDIEADLIQFINEYIDKVYKPLASNIDINFKNLSTKQFYIKFKPIEIPIIIDNLLSNSKKAHAKKVEIEAFNTKEDNFVLTFRDDGDGLDKRITAIEEIFEMGYTTTSGSGLGLSHVRQILKALNGSIVANTDLPKGLEFIITFQK